MNNIKPAITVTQLNKQIRLWLEQDVGMVSVIGELSNLSKPSSGHYYFTLKDQTAQVRCVFFRNQHRAAHQFTEGQQVIAFGRLSLYEARGDYQLIVQELTLAGIGQLYQQFEQLKIKLEQLGLFDAQRKKPLKRFPTCIAIVTSSTSAALQDMLSTLARRYPIAKIMVYHCEVQGKNAPPQIINAIKQANHDALADVILLARGGGSIEDLWAFNNEHLAYTISESQLPIISGIGHETDFTIADFVADWRAPTPTGAAEAATPDRAELEETLLQLKNRLLVAINRLLTHYRLVLSHHHGKLLSPTQTIARYWQTLDYRERQLTHYVHSSLNQRRHRFNILLAALQAKNPKTVLTLSKAHLHHYEQQLLQAITKKIHRLKQSFTQQLTTLEAVSPLATLARGYSIVSQNDHVVFDAQNVSIGDSVQIRLSKGQLTCEVIRIKC